MIGALQSIIRSGNRSTLKALLYACVATEAENLEHWRQMCPNPDHCPVAAAVKASPEERDQIIEDLSDQQAMNYLIRYFECYERDFLNGKASHAHA